MCVFPLQNRCLLLRPLSQFFSHISIGNDQIVGVGVVFQKFTNCGEQIVTEAMILPHYLTPTALIRKQNKQD